MSAMLGRHKSNEGILRDCGTRYWPRREEAMKTAGRGTQTRYAAVRSKPSTWGGRAEKILLNLAGWKVREIPAMGEFFFLTSPFIERCSMPQSTQKK
jgi:hypothetical protein